MKKALGLIEVAGLATAMVALDAALKSANVTLLGVEPAKGGGYHTLKLEGNVGAVNAAISAAKGHPEVAGKVISVKVIPRPAIGIDAMVHSKENLYQKIRKIPEGAETKTLEATEEKEAAKIEAQEPPKKTADKEEIEKGKAPLSRNLDEKKGEKDEKDAPPPAKKAALAKAPKTLPLKSQKKSSAQKKDDGARKQKEDASNTALGNPLEEEPSEKALEEEPSEKALEEEPSEEALEEEPSKETTPSLEPSCNLCGDPKCPRHKGEPHSTCIHNKKKENRK